MTGTGCTGATCGTVTPATSGSGVAVSYTSALGSAESRDGNLEGDVSGRYDEIGFGDDYGYDHGGTHCGDGITDLGERKYKRHTTLYGHASSMIQRTRASLDTYWSRLYGQRLRHYLARRPARRV